MVQKYMRRKPRNIGLGSAVNSFIESQLKSKFVKRVLLLATGTALGQVIAIIALPILTRLYAPESFAVLAVYVSILAIISSIAGLCFEYAIPLPKQDKVAAALCSMAVFSTLLITTLAGLLVNLSPQLINQLTEHKIAGYLWLIPVGVFAIGMYNALQYWSTRKKQFGLIAKTRVTQSLTGTGAKLLAGWYFIGATVGLIIGQLLSQGAGFISLGLSILKNDSRTFKALKKKHFIVAAKRYKNFPKYTTLAVLANTAGIQVPILLIAYFALGAEAGYLMVAMQLMSAPLSMIGGAVSQVYLAEGAEKYHQGELRAFTKTTIWGLVKVSFVPLALLFFVAPWLMPLLLGENWGRTGTLISWMVPWFFMQFITSPVSTALYFTEKQRLALVLQIAGLLIRTLMVFLAGIFAVDIIGEVYALSGLLFYMIYLLVVLHVIKVKSN